MFTIYQLAQLGISKLNERKSELDRKIHALERRLEKLTTDRNGLVQDIIAANSVIDTPKQPINWATIDTLIRNGKKIEAIKIVRDHSQCSLMDSKTIIEDRMSYIKRTEYATA